MNRWFEKLWHGILRRPYHLAAPVDKGRGTPVVLLHGIASNHRSWGYVLPHIKNDSRVIALDLLGFGQSPKPEENEYTVQEHARAVLATLHKLRVRGPIVLAGHSMGGLVAVEIAKQRPKLVQQLVLCGMPLYRFDRKRRLLPHQDSAYLRLYQEIIERQDFTLKAFARLEERRGSEMGVSLKKENWEAFKHSLTNTIIKQTAFDDVRQLKMPVCMVYGRLDVFVIRRHAVALKKLAPDIGLRFVNEPHELSDRHGRSVAEEINAAVEGRPVISPPRFAKLNLAAFKAKLARGASVEKS